MTKPSSPARYTLLPTLCEHCAYWKPLKHTELSDYTGECHRHAPTLSPGKIGTVPWPKTHAEDFCGDGLEL